MRNVLVSSVRSVRSAAVLAVVVVVACGGDSKSPTAPGYVSSQDALQSLTRILTPSGSVSGAPAVPVTLAGIPPISDALAPQVGKANVTVDGQPVQMFALVLRVTYPSGSCLEQLLPGEGLGNSGTCIAPPGGLSMILWQTSSGTQIPDKVIFVLADIGTVTFTDLTALDSASFATSTKIPALAFYIDRSGSFWTASSGTLSSSVSTGGVCSMPLPIFAKAATCSVGTFAESGNLSFAPLDIGSGQSNQPSGTHTLVMPPQMLAGTVQTVTATTPVTLPTP